MEKVSTANFLEKYSARNLLAIKIRPVNSELSLASLSITQEQAEHSGRAWCNWGHCLLRQRETRWEAKNVRMGMNK